MDDVWRVGQVVDGRYEVRQVHEDGGMGLVYRVRHVEWGTDLAVKCPRAEMFRTSSQRERFVAEAEIWVSLGLHPNVCGCHYVRVLDGIPRVFAEYVPGGSLRGWITGGRLYDGGPAEALARLLDVAVQVAWGLAHAHDRGLVHQDVKPANVLMDVTADGVVAKVTDFGLARARSVTAPPPAAGTPSVTSPVVSHSGGLTPAYASPEQFEGQPLDRRTDVYSFAVSVLEMFTGRIDWMSGVVAGSALAARRERSQPDIPDLPPALADLLERALDPDPAARPASMAEIAAELAEIFRRVTGAPYPRPAPAAADLRADELNNRGVSLLDLGRTAEADEAFAAALAADPQHLNATYNAGLLRWRRGECTDEDLITTLKASGAGSAETRRLLAAVHRERGDHDQADALEGRPPSGRSGGARGVPWWIHRESVEEFLGMSVTRRTPPTYVRFTADGRRAVTAGDGVLCVWDTGDGRCLRKVKAPGVEFIFDISADGRYAITSAPDAVHFWDLAGGRRLRVIHPPKSWTRSLWSASVHLSGDGRVAVAAGYDGNVRVWDFPSGRLLLTLEGHESTVAAAVDHAGRTVFTAGREDGTARVWEVATGRCLHVFDARIREGHVGVDTLGLLGDLAVLAAWGRIRVWNLRTGDVVTLDEHTSVVRSLAVSGDHLVSAGADDTVRLWELDGGRCLRTFRADGGPVRTARLDGDVLLSAWQAGGVRWWTVPPRHTAPSRLSRPREHAELSGLDATVADLMERARAADPRTALGLLTEARSVPGYEREPRLLAAWRELGRSAVRAGVRSAWAVGVFEADTTPYALAVHADGPVAVSGGGDGTVRVWDVGTGACRRVSGRHPSLVNAVGIGGDGSRVTSASRDGTIAVWSAATGERIGGLDRPLALGVTSAAFDPDGRFALAAGADAVIRLWNLGTGACERELPGHAGNVGALWFGPDVAASGGADGVVRLWDLATGRCVRTMDGHTGRVTSVCLSPDGRYALSAGGDAIRLWDAATGECLRVLGDPTGHVRFTPDGRFAVSGGTGAGVRIWEPAAGRCLRVLDGHGGEVHAVAVAADARFVLSSSADGSVRRWELDWDLRMP